MVLLQTLVLSIILSMIAVMVMKWVLGRYMLAARNYRSTVAKVHSQGYAPRNFSSWNFNLAAIPSSGGNFTMDTQTVRYDTNGGSASMRRFIVSSDEDQ